MYRERRLCTRVATRVSSNQHQSDSVKTFIDDSDKNVDGRGPTRTNA